MDNEILSDEQVAIWIEIIEARGGGLPDQELQAIKVSHAALQGKLGLAIQQLEEFSPEFISEEWMTALRGIPRPGPEASEDEEKMITNGHTD